MKKQGVLILAALFTASVSGTTLAASTNPFDDVPKGHWAYSAINQLVKDGVIGGYSNGTFNGDKPVTRYEMAVIVGKAMSNSNKAAVEKATAEDRAALEKLETEFSTELKDLGVRVEKLEKYAAGFKWWGDARYRYQTDYKNDMKNTNTYENSSHIQARLRLGIWGNVADNLEVYGRVKIDNDTNVYDGWSSTPHSASGSHGNAFLDLMGLNWYNKDLKVSVGRIPVNIGQGAIWGDNNPVDGIYATYNFGKVAVSAGWGDLTAENWKAYNMPAFMANISAPVGDRTNITMGHLKTNTSDNTLSIMRYNAKTGAWTAPYALDQYSYGFNTKLQDKLTLLAEYVTNRADNLPSEAQRNGWWSRLTYGNRDWKKANTYEVYFYYVNFGNWSIDSTGWGHSLNVAGGNGLGNDGDKGWGVGISYMLASNTNFELNCYKLKPYDAKLSGFSYYKTNMTAALTYSF